MIEDNQCVNQHKTGIVSPPSRKEHCTLSINTRAIREWIVYLICFANSLPPLYRTDLSVFLVSPLVPPEPLIQWLIDRILGHTRPGQTRPAHNTAPTSSIQETKAVWGHSCVPWCPVVRVTQWTLISHRTVEQHHLSQLRAEWGEKSVATQTSGPWGTWYEQEELTWSFSYFSRPRSISA